MTYNLTEMKLNESGTKDSMPLELAPESTNQIRDLRQTDTNDMEPKDFELEPTQLELESTENTAQIEEYQPINFDLEYLRLKRDITEECVKLQIFTPAGVKKLCERKTRTRTDLDPDLVAKLIDQILRELELD